MGLRIILSELIEEFWILRALKAIKKVLHKCLPCKMAKAHRGYQIEASLPTDRITPQKHFGVTGIDFAGPLYIKVGSNMRKGYISLPLHVLLHVPFIRNYALIRPLKSYCWLSNYSWGEEDCHIPSTRTTPRPSMPPTNTWPNYGHLYLQQKLTNFLLITKLIGSLSLREQLGGEGVERRCS
jgi:hypothetical protein